MRLVAGLLLIPIVGLTQGPLPDGPAAGQPPALSAQRLLENLRTERYSGRPADLVVRDARLAEVLAGLGRTDGLRFDLDPAIRDRVSYAIRGRPWDAILARVLADWRLRLDIDSDGTGFKVHRGAVHVVAFQDQSRLRATLFLYRNLWRLAAGLAVAVGVVAAYAVLRRRAEGRRATAKRPQLSPEKAEETRRRLLALFEVSRIYLRENLSLRDLAGELGVTPHQLSWLINDGLSLSFSDLVNGYRVAAAKARLADSRLDSATILEVGFEAGFGTKAAFNRAFRKHTGMTPSEYRGRFSIGRDPAAAANA